MYKIILMKKNKMIKSLFTFCFLVFTFYLHAQDVFLSAGKIEFEKKVNAYKNIDEQMDDNNGNWKEQLKKMVPEYIVTYFNLSFDSAKTLYAPGRENTTQKIQDWMKGPATDNVVFSDLNQQKMIAQKNAYEATFLVQDSTRKIDWKITNDSRTIAGIDCRKAVGIIMDSIFVVAFYTDQITTSGGPESFNGLPGMILGVAIPRIHTTWFATKIETTKPTAQELAAPAKGKKVNNQQLVEQLKSTMKDWGKWGQRTQWAIML